jgi:hypothetical protein
MILSYYCISCTMLITQTEELGMWKYNVLVKALDLILIGLQL